MLFKDVKQNYPVYILNKRDVTIAQGKVTNVSFPHIDTNAPYRMQTSPAQAQMVVDVSIEAEGKTATYTIPENLAITYAGDLVLSTDKASLVNEIEALKNSAEQIIASVEHNKSIVEKATTLLSDMNPVYKEKQETEKRLTKMEGDVSEIKKMLSELSKQLK